MDLTIDITSSCRVRVLLVPVSPIKKSTFWKYAELVTSFKTVRLGDVTPDMQKGSSAMFSSQVFQEGQMHFQFLTSSKRDDAHLEDFQPHRRIYGVIGIMDCQDWKDKDLEVGYKQFTDTVAKLPGPLAVRCFAFDPTEHQSDDTKGLIMIPNVGNMSFYMSTMICDFASDILNQFAVMAERIEHLDILESPVPRMYSQAREESGRRIVPQPSSSSPIAGGSSNAPSPAPSTSSSFLKRASNATISRSPTPSSRASVSVDTNKTKRCTPGRVKKLIADFYLLSGRLPDAVKLYHQSIDMTKTLQDYLWLASAIEGLACASLLLEYLHMNVGDIVTRSPPVTSPTEVPETSSPSPEPKSTLNETMDHYGSALSNYIRASNTSGVPIPGLIYVETCAKVARFLFTVYFLGGWSDKVLSLLLNGTLSESPLPSAVGPLDDEILSRIRKPGLIWRYEIASWAMRVWNPQLEDVQPLAQISLMNHMVAILNAIGFHRKAALLMHVSVHRILPLLIQGRATAASSHDPARQHLTKNDSGILEVLKRMCEVYGIVEKVVKSQSVMEPTPMNAACSLHPSGPSLIPLERQCGWPLLQVALLRQCIAVSEALPDYPSMLYYTTVLLKTLYRYISKEEQIRLASSIQRIVAIGKRAGQVDNHTNYWEVNILSSIEAAKPIPRKAVYEHPLKTDTVAAAIQSGTAVNDPFIYNPYAEKKEEKHRINLVKNEPCEFKVVLINPFAFDLELQDIMPSTSGVKFTASTTSAIIPANGTLGLQLVGIPEEIGTLVVRGCLIKLVGFAEQEFLVYVSQSNTIVLDPRPNASWRLKRSGLDAIRHCPPQQQPMTSEPKFYQLEVIDEQPLLKIHSTSLLHGAVMLYEGEMTQISIKLENIGSIPVDFIMLSFTDSTSLHPVAMNPDLSPEDQYEVELFSDIRVITWDGTGDDTKTVGRRVWLNPGDQLEVKVNVYGKRGCTGGTVQIDYGYLDRTQPPETSDGNTIESSVGGNSSFYTRQLYLPVLITVYQNLETMNWDVMYLRPNVLLPQQDINAAMNRLTVDPTTTSNEQPIEDILAMTQQAEHEQRKNDCCLVALDVRNIWSVPFIVRFSVEQKEGNMNQDAKDDEQPIIISLTIQPGGTKRIVLPIKRIFLEPESCEAPIPSLEPNKQFVVSQSAKLPPNQEQARLQMFWYRESLLKRLQATWECCVTGRQGIIDVRSTLRLSPLQLSILKKEDVEFIIRVDPAQQIGHRRFACETNRFVTMTISIHNRRQHSASFILRVQPVQSYDRVMKEYDLTDKLLVHGLLQVVLDKIPTNSITTHTIPLCFLSRGRFEFLYHVEDVHTREVHYDHDWAVISVYDHDSSS